jgi:hypothetical protein
MTLKEVFWHAAILIPIEFGILHATALGPMITAGFQNLFASMGFATGTAHVAGEALVMG